MSKSVIYPKIKSAQCAVRHTRTQRGWLLIWTQHTRVLQSSFVSSVERYLAAKTA